MSEGCSDVVSRCGSPFQDLWSLGMSLNQQHKHLPSEGTSKVHVNSLPRKFRPPPRVQWCQAGCTLHCLAGSTCLSPSMSASIPGHHITLQARDFILTTPLWSRCKSSKSRCCSFQPSEFAKANTDPLRSACGVECDTASALWLLCRPTPVCKLHH